MTVLIVPALALGTLCWLGSIWKLIPGYRRGLIGVILQRYAQEYLSMPPAEGGGAICFYYDLCVSG